MKSNNIQLPPLPIDTPLESVEMIWLYARLPDGERKMLREILEKDICSDEEKRRGYEWANMIENVKERTDPDLEQFAELMRGLLQTLIVQACETAGAVYQHYCADGKSVEETAEAIKVPVDLVELVAQYYNQ